jgi:catechol 2,3-dioxygenase-like lactoylglutathione lyase family enzyme
MIEGINHITLSVKDLVISFEFYTEILGFKPLARWDKGAYLLAGDSWICLSLDSKTRENPLDEYSHIAFSVSEINFKKLSRRIRKLGFNQWHNNKSEGDSLYFLDPDNHKLEIHVGNWKTRLNFLKSRSNSSIQFF